MTEIDRKISEAKESAAALIRAIHDKDEAAFEVAATSWSRDGFTDRNPQEDVHSAILNSAFAAERAAASILLAVIANHDGAEAVATARANYEELRARSARISQQWFGGDVMQSVSDTLREPPEA